MAGARHETEQLRARQYKVEDLGQKEEDESFRKVSLDSHSREGHPGKVAECVARKGSSWIPAVRRLRELSLEGAFLTNCAKESRNKYR